MHPAQPLQPPVQSEQDTAEFEQPVPHVIPQLTPQDIEHPVHALLHPLTHEPPHAVHKSAQPFMQLFVHAPSQRPVHPDLHEVFESLKPSFDNLDKRAIILS